MDSLRIQDSRLLIGLALGPLLLLATACTTGSKEDELVIKISELESSGQTGTTTLRVKDSQTEVLVQVSPGPKANDPQPAHIHFGKCGPTLGNVHYPLSNIVDGKSTTLVNATLQSIRDGNHNINIHKSTPEIRIYTACGNIPAS